MSKNDATGMDAVEQPAAVGLLLRPHHLDCLGHTGIGFGFGRPEVVERAEHVVVPVVGERELEIGRLCNFAGALAAEQAALEQVVLTRSTRGADLVGTTGRSLEREQTVEHVDRRVERRSHRPVLGLAVPSAVLESFAEDAIDDRRDVHAEVRAGLDRPPVDAGLDLTIEEALPGVLPASVLGDERDRSARRLGLGLQPEKKQRLQGVHRRRPRLARFAARVRERRGEARAARPQPVGVLCSEQAGAPSFALHPRPFARDFARRRVSEITQDLPADGRVAVEQPLDHVHP